MGSMERFFFMVCELTIDSMWVYFLMVGNFIFLQSLLDKEFALFRQKEEVSVWIFISEFEYIFFLHASNPGNNCY